MKVGIVGLGLIGGSLGLDLRSRGIEVIGVSRRHRTCEVALVRGVVDRASVDLAVLEATDIIFICTPLTAIAPTIEQLLPYLSPKTILTDVGSVKQSIVRSCSRLRSNFVGGHPMAGTAEKGIEAAQSGLFVNAPYVLTPIETTPPEAVQAVEEAARAIGCIVYYCSPEVHDRAVALISHLPLLVSAGLIETCLGEADSTVLQLAQQLASSGFRDTSRVGGGNPELGVAIARHNRPQVLQTLSQYRQTLDRLIDAIQGENWQELEEILQSAQQARPNFLKGS
ncbi:prephenate/arogenate dehydrogenase [Lusitaniella coriacea]|uniref:prephenate/arogenate dehydrogenase n=1 Tax=Lusitaniella coriacea TaxID=1983105 RepID=UPI003CEF5FE7